jgi:hypothetical protein
MRISAIRTLLAYLARPLGIVILLAFVVSSSIGAAGSVPEAAASVHAAADVEHHHAAMSMAVDCHSFGDRMDGDLGDAPCQEHPAMLHCTSAPCCFQNENDIAKSVAVGGLSQLRHPLSNGSAVLSRLTVPHDRPPRLI